MARLRTAAAALAVVGGVFGTIAVGGFAVGGCGDSSGGPSDDAAADQTNDSGGGGPDTGRDSAPGVKDATSGGDGGGGGDADATVAADAGDASDSSRDGDATVDSANAGDSGGDADAATTSADGSDAADAVGATDGSDAADASDALDAAVDAWDGGPNPIQQYAIDYGNAFCAGQGKCCPGYDAGAFNQAACAAAWKTQGWEYTLPANAAAYAAGHLTFNTTQGAACLSALQSFACTTLGTVTAQQYSAVTTACLGVLTGTIAAGSGGCLSSFECANGFCTLPTDGGTGTCTALVGDGGSCSPGNDSPDQMCHQAGLFVPKAWCNRLDGGATGQCVAPLPDGATCYDSVVSPTYYDDYGCVNLLCGDNSQCGTPATYPTPPPGFCENWPADAGGGG